MCIKKVKVTQSCPTLCDPMDYTVHGILQASILEWVGEKELGSGSVDGPLWPFWGCYNNAGEG